jgi:hypothetical protein
MKGDVVDDPTSPQRLGYCLFIGWKLFVIYASYAITECSAPRYRNSPVFPSRRARSNSGVEERWPKSYDTLLEYCGELDLLNPRWFLGGGLDDSSGSKTAL